jgi:acetoin utilization protein AcuB
MRVGDWMSPDPLTVTPSTPVREARGLLHRYGIRHLPVVDRVVGVVSDRDVRGDRRVDAEVAETMSSPPHVIHVDDPIEAAARAMLSRHISALPVLEDDRLVGIITTTDCLLAYLSRTPDGAPARAGDPPEEDRPPR